MDFCLGVNGLGVNLFGGLMIGNCYYKVLFILEFESGVFF